MASPAADPSPSVVAPAIGPAIPPPTALAEPQAAPASLGGARTFVALAMAHFLADCFGGMWPVYKKLAGLDLAVAGLIATAVTMVGTATQPLFGIWADRRTRRGFIVLGCALTFAGMTLGPLTWLIPTIGWRNAYLAMFLIMLLVRLGQDMFHPAGASLAGNFSPQRRSTLVALFVAAGSIGFAISQTAFSLTFKHANRHTELLLIPGGLMLAMIWAWCRPVEQPARQPPPLRAMLADLRLAGRGLLVLFAILSLSAGVNIGFYFLLPEFVAGRGYPAWMADGGAYAFFILGSVILMVPAGHLADRIGRRATLIVVLLLSLVSYYVIVLLPTIPVAGFLAICLLAGGFMGTANPLGIAFGQHLAPRNVGMTSALMMGLAWCVGSLAPGIVGYHAKRVGPAETLLWLGTINVVVLALALLLPGRRDEDAVPAGPPP